MPTSQIRYSSTQLNLSSFFLAIILALGANCQICSSTSDSCLSNENPVCDISNSLCRPCEPVTGETDCFRFPGASCLWSSQHNQYICAVCLIDAHCNGIQSKCVNKQCIDSMLFNQIKGATAPERQDPIIFAIAPEPSSLRREKNRFQSRALDSIKSSASNAANSVINSVKEMNIGSNFELILNVGPLADFNYLTSPLFYIIIGFTLLMVIISIWAVLKDRSLDRDLLKLPEKAPSKLYRLLVYILITHTFFCIFALFEKANPRVMRSVLFYTKIVGLMALSTIFNQNDQDLGGVGKTLFAIVAVIAAQPINLLARYIIFRRQTKPKLRRKRLNRQRFSNGRAITEQLSHRNTNTNETLHKILMIAGYLLLVGIILGYIFIIFVITANNIKTNSEVVQKWLDGFLQSLALELFVIQIGKVLLHLSIISALKNNSKKKFLCVPRQHLPKMLNPTIFDFQKRFATLDRLYKNGPGIQLELPNPEFGETGEVSGAVPSGDRVGSLQSGSSSPSKLQAVFKVGLAMQAIQQPADPRKRLADIRKNHMLNMRSKMSIPTSMEMSSPEIQKVRQGAKVYKANEKQKQPDDPVRWTDCEQPEQAQSEKSLALKQDGAKKKLKSVVVKKLAAPHDEIEENVDE